MFTAVCLLGEEHKTLDIKLLNLEIDSHIQKTLQEFSCILSAGDIRILLNDDSFESKKENGILRNRDNNNIACKGSIQ